ncbi:hypothetical protein A0H81_09756 [Grifola frondosa]|uniref:RGS domain-containing protein n=1 Tax=Grifola frondosa TaxID=5627 RepID=A0A1C7M1I1_GRIFR|nr:hypothetical protein A0H81_09756 [Grifola frondosa]
MPTTSRTTLLLGPDYAAVLSRYASSISLKSHLSEISLANVLSGDTCSPISLADFEAYLAFSVRTIPRSTASAYLTPPGTFPREPPLRRLVPGLPQALLRPSRTHPGHQPRPQGLLLLPPHPRPHRPAHCRQHSAHRHVPLLPRHLPQPRQHKFRLLPAIHAPAHQPFRAECARVAAAFLHPRAPKELPLDSALRDAILRDLTWNTHPDVFLPAYEETHDVLASLFWYAAGLADTLLALILALSLIAAGRPARAWRLFAVPLAALGAMQAYSAWRGFCSQVWGRGGTQLRAWELQGTDVEAPAEPHWDWVGPALSRATSVPDEKGKAREAPHESKNQQHQPQVAEGEKKDAPAPALRRPPVFGPERVVLDPRIRAVHRAVMRDILFVGFWWTVVFTVVVLAVPGVRRG